MNEYAPMPDRPRPIKTRYNATLNPETLELKVWQDDENGKLDYENLKQIGVWRILND